jgi:hypothetical protein
MDVELAHAQAAYRSQGIRADVLPYPIRKLSENSGDGGTSSKRLLRKLAREFPDVLDRYEAGEFPNVKTAAREAGIVPPKPTKFEQIVKWIDPGAHL